MSITNQIVNWLKTQLETAGADGFVAGLSGGVDSATVTALAVRSVGPDNVLGVLMPCHSQADDARLGQLMADSVGISTITVDLGPAYDALASALPTSEHPLAAANIKPRLRMTTLYYLAQSNNYLVLGSGNATEIAVGYFTKYGDGGTDLFPIGDLSKTQVWELARELGVPKEIVTRAPSAGLWPGQTDEAEMGITYTELDGILAAISSGDTSAVDPMALDKVQRMVAASAHKRAMPPICRVQQ